MVVGADPVVEVNEVVDPRFLPPLLGRDGKRPPGLEVGQDGPGISGRPGRTEVEGIGAPHSHPLPAVIGKPCRELPVELDGVRHGQIADVAGRAAASDATMAFHAFNEWFIAATFRTLPPKVTSGQRELQKDHPLDAVPGSQNRCRAVSSSFR